MTLTPSIDSLLGFIKSEQQLNGSFISYCTSENSNIQTPLKNTFTTSLILGCLNEMPEKLETRKIIDQGIDFLLSEKNPDWSWNYHSLHQTDTVPKQQNFLKTKSSPYPNDWDDTACALIGISLYRKEILSPEIFGAITKLLVATESKPGGPYYTWMFNEQNKEWKDLDPVVNANIGYFLKLHGINLPPLEKYIEEIISTSNYTSHYYHTPEAVIYFISRYYSGPLTKKFSNYLLNRQNKNGLWENDLLTALVASSLIRANVSDDLLNNAVDHLKETVIKNDWQAYPLYIESNKEIIVYNGAPALTAAFILETLTLWDKRQNNTGQLISGKQKIYSQELHEEIITSVKKRLALFPEKTIQTTRLLLTKMLAKDLEHQITLLPYFFSQSLHSNQPESKSLLQTLGEINLYGWFAYTVYDNILDKDSGPELLPVANICLRELISIYKEVLTPDSFILFQEKMDLMEQANAWENIYCQISQERIITEKNILQYPENLLSDKSIPHAFGPITILLSLKYKINSKEVQHTLSFFKNYLTSRQLNDDAHDWQEDLGKGFLNSVSSSLLHTYFKANPSLRTLDISKEKQSLQALFWESHIITIAEEINIYIKKAQTDLDQLELLQLIKDRQYFERLLAPLQQSTQQIKSNQKEIRNFLESYQS
jgi:hypothetical protein